MFVICCDESTFKQLLFLILVYDDPNSKFMHVSHVSHKASWKSLFWTSPIENHSLINLKKENQNVPLGLNFLIWVYLTSVIADRFQISRPCSQHPASQLSQQVLQFQPEHHMKISEKKKRKKMKKNNITETNQGSKAQLNGQDSALEYLFPQPWPSSRFPIGLLPPFTFEFLLILGKIYH